MTDNLSSLSRVDVVLREFKEGDAAAFRRLNEEWILRYFRLEEKDETTFADPRSAILDRGGRILFATILDANGNEEHVGCCALLAMGDGGYELGKMAVSPRRQGRGIGGLLLRAAVELARQMGARRVYLETNHVLTPAIRLYESVGFRHLDPATIPPSPYSRSDMAMELILAEGNPEPAESL